MGYGPRITKGDSERGINNMGESENGLKRQIGLFGAVAILVGAVIGSGIFMTPGTVARRSQRNSLFIGICGIVSGHAQGRRALCLYNRSFWKWFWLCLRLVHDYRKLHSFGCHACNWICKQSGKADTGNYSCRN